ncbi:tetratricopeptide repeat protein [Sphingopyxis sp. NFH-91]|uniref:tetratricopeptide repeat protein n=1 Tax=unclassified Sphingopyxis TaxID=2614943 RepID=UPI001F2E0877|nr:tetratricopeptide repeat protein [Sphingopyxis sp. NFH-91]
MFKRFRQTSATAVAAVLGCALIVAAPAAAKEKPKKEEEEKGAQLKPSKEFSPALKKLTEAAKAKDMAALEAALAEGQASATSPDDKYLVSFYELQLGIGKSDKAIQGKALDGMLESGLTPPESLAAYNFFSGNFAYGDKDYAKAVKRLEAAKAAGSTEQGLPVLLMDSYLKLNQVDQGLAVAKEAIAAARAAGRVPSEELYVRPAGALQAAKRNGELLDMLAMRLEDYPQPVIWRNTLFILLQQEASDKVMNLDTFRLMRATKSMTQRPEYLEYAALATEAGYPSEAVAVIKEGQAANVIQTSDERFNTILESQEPRAKADAVALKADAAKAATAANPKLARQTADGLVGIGDYATAISLYEKAAAGGDPLAQYRLGVAQALAGQKDAAIASFAKVQGDRARLANLWTIHLSAKAPAAAAAAAPAAAPAN